jgi:hypothetical protein
MSRVMDSVHRGTRAICHGEGEPSAISHMVPNQGQGRRKGHDPFRADNGTSLACEKRGGRKRLRPPSGKQRGKSLADKIDLQSLKSQRRM